MTARMTDPNVNHRKILGQKVLLVFPAAASSSGRSFIPFDTVTWSARKLDRVPWFVAKLLYGELKSTYVAVSFPSVKKWLDT